MKKAKDLVSYVKTKIGYPYLYGFKQNEAWNKKCTTADFNRLKKAYGSMIWDSDRTKCVGKYPCDCSGLISAFTGVQRGSSNMKTTATKVLPISKITQAQAGCILWKQGHVGVLIHVGKKVDGSDSYYIAEDGSAYGCQKRPVSWQKWTHILYLKDLDYTEEKVKKETTKKDTDTKKSTVTYYKKYTGKSVSFVDALKEMKIDDTFTNRAKIAVRNGVVKKASAYKGTSEQNTKMFDLLKKGKLIKKK